MNSPHFANADRYVPFYMRVYLVILLSIIFTSCCCNYEDKDFEFTPTHLKLIQPYSAGDTIYFSNQLGALDTITISKIDTLQDCGCLMVGNRRYVSVEIKHLPTNLWTGGKEMPSQEQPGRTLDQDLISIEKTLYGKEGNSNGDKENYFIAISYRNAFGELKNLADKKTDSLFKSYDINEYWIIHNETADWQENKSDSHGIITLYWTERYGLTGYELRNGEKYTIKKKNGT